MFKNLTIAMVGLGFLLSSPASAQDFQYVGNSTGLAKGGDGVVALTELCSIFGAGARICTSEEILLSTEPPAVDTTSPDPQWVLPTFANGAFKIFDVSGVEGQPLSLSCQGWRTNSSTGLTVSDDGEFEKKGCGTDRQVACCQVPGP